VQDINAVLGGGPTSPRAEGAAELDAESHRQRYELPKQQPKVPSRRLKNAILAVILVLVAGIIGYWAYDLTSFTSLPTRENEEVEDTTKGSASVELKGSSLTISGKGLELYYVYDASGQKQLNSKFTGQIIELLPGTYQVELHKNRVPVQVRAKEKSTL
jgi:hypothetical protein